MEKASKARAPGKEEEMKKEKKWALLLAGLFFLTACQGLVPEGSVRTGTLPLPSGCVWHLPAEGGGWTDEDPPAGIFPGMEVPVFNGLPNQTEVDGQVYLLSGCSLSGGKPGAAPPTAQPPEPTLAPWPTNPPLPTGTYGPPPTAGPTYEYRLDPLTPTPTPGPPRGEVEIAQEEFGKFLDWVRGGIARYWWFFALAMVFMALGFWRLAKIEDAGNALRVLGVLVALVGLLILLFAHAAFLLAVGAILTVAGLLVLGLTYLGKG